MMDRCRGPDCPVPDWESSDPEASSGTPDRVGSYRVVGIVGAGGMGTVYRAEQENPRRVVALKVLHPVFSSPDALSRFKHEAEILAYLKHPAIAQVYEAGMFRLGGVQLPFFAMEYVEGARTLTEHGANLDMRSRLRVMVEVCDAVHHGHQRGVIHRDLKPANILVGEDGHPKVIDFGLARVVKGGGTPDERLTKTGLVLGTPQYMSPEQIRGLPDDLDLRSDVYALGVVLYELLTGRLPHESASGDVSSLMLAILENAPKRPSAVVAGLSGDLETILLKAIEKDRERRYQSALELKRDLERYLASEPILAQPPGLVHNVVLFARRNRLAAGALVAAAFSLVVAAVIGITLAVKAERARKDAVAAESRAAAVNLFLTSLIRSANPEAPRERSLLAEQGGDSVVYAAAAGREATVSDLLARAAKMLDRQSLTPEAEAELRLTIGDALAGTTAGDLAAKQLQRAVALREERLGRNHRLTVEAIERLANLAFLRGDLVVSLASHRDAYVRAEAGAGPGDPLTIRCAAGVGTLLTALDQPGAAVTFLNESLKKAIETRGPGDLEVSLHSLDAVHPLCLEGHREEALRRAQAVQTRIAELAGRDSPAYARVVFRIADAFVYLGRWAEAEKPLRTALDLRLRIYGEDHPETISTVDYLGWTLEELGRLEEALPLRDQAHQLCLRYYPETHPSVLAAKNSLSYTLSKLGRRPEEAIVLAEQAVAGAVKIFGPRSSQQLNYGDTMAEALRAAGRRDLAEDVFRSNVRVARDFTQPGRWWPLGHHLLGLGRCLRESGKFAEAERELLETYQRLHATEFSGRTASLDREIQNELVILYEAWGRPGEAEKWRRSQGLPPPPESSFQTRSRETSSKDRIR